MNNIGIYIIDQIRGTDILKKYKLLRELVSDTIISNTLKKDHLVKMLIALKENAFYKPLLQHFPPSYIADKPIEVLLSLPISDKQMINKHYNSIYTPIDSRPSQKKKTGGSTGNPLYYHVDKEHLSWFWAHIYYFWNRFSNFKPGDPFVTIAGNSLRTVNRQLSENIYHYLQNNYFITGDIIDKNISIKKNKIQNAVLIYGYPSSIMNILKVKPDITNYTTNVRAIFTTSEQLLPQTRHIIENAFHKPVYDMYGANDGGILTCECPEHDGYHINMLNCYVESFINEFGMSELLLTNLNSHNFPFVRYRVGDIGKVDNSICKCGLNWPRIYELKGRTRDLIHLPDGKGIHGSFFNSVFYKHPSIDGYKIIQQKNYSIVIYLHVKDPNDYKKVSTSVISELSSFLGNIIITTEHMSEVNPTNIKFKLIESHVD